MHHPALRYLTFFVGFFTVTILGHYYLYRKLIKEPGLNERNKKYAITALLFMFTWLMITFPIRRLIPQDLAYILVSIPYIWLAFMMLLISVFALIDLLLYMIRFIMYLSGHSAALLKSRQVILYGKTFPAILFVMGLTIMALFNGSQAPIVNEVEIPLAKFPKEMNGFRVVQLTDLHIDVNFNCTRLDGVVAQVRGLNPDLIVLTGDLVDNDPIKIGPCVTRLGQLRAPYGVYWIPGNHEYYAGVEAWVPFLDKLGIKYLLDRRIAIDVRPGVGFDLLGVDDYSQHLTLESYGREMDQVLAGHQSERETVMLAHQPIAVKEAAQRDIGLVLSGHTHAGQIWPFCYFVRAQQPYIEGLHYYNARTAVYINQGMFYWGPPLRLGTHNEIALIRLRRA